MTHSFGSQAARLQGALVRSVYRALVPVLARPRRRPVATLPLHMVWFSGEAHLPEQVLSVRTLIAHAGRPERATIVSDGSHRPSSRRHLEAIDPAVRVVHWRRFAATDALEAIGAYAHHRSGMGKKLAVELSLPAHEPAAYADADVRFFAHARALASLAEASDGPPAWYLADCDPYLDERMLDAATTATDVAAATTTTADAAAADTTAAAAATTTAITDARLAPPVNAGFFVVRRPLRWDGALARLGALDGDAGHWSEQTAVHLAMHASGARPLDPRRFVVADDDAWRWGDAHAGPHLALRHYVTTVRHKLWCSVVRSGGS